MNIADFISRFTTKKELGWQSFFGLAGNANVANNKSLYFGTVFACIDTIANAIAEIDWEVYNKNADEPFKNHPLYDLINHPNDLQSATDFFYLLSTHIDTAGQAFIYPVRSKLGNKVIELHILNPENMTTITNQKSPINEVLGYKYAKNNQVFPFDKDEIINIIRPNPYNQVQGLSTIAMARYDATSELNSLESNNLFYENGTQTSGILKTDQQLNSDVFNKLKSAIRGQYEGKKNQFKMMFLTHGLDYKPISPSQRDMQYVEQRKLNRDQILTIFKVPKSMVAVSDNVNKATAEAENLAFARNVVKPRLDLIFDKINMFLLPELGYSDLELRYENPVKDDQEFELKEKVESVRRWKTPNEIREIEGLPPIEGGDELSSTQSLFYRDEQGSLPSDGGSKPEADEEEAESKKKDITHVYNTKEALPDPKEAKGKQNQEYQRRKNRYIVSKEKTYAQALKQHFNFLIRDVKKAYVKKDIGDDIDLTDEAVFEQVMPNREQRDQWKMLLYLLILEKNTQVWKTAQKQMDEVYGLPSELNDITANYISRQAVQTASGISDTTFNRVRQIISNDLDSGVRDLREIKNNISYLLNDQKEWKIDQIAQTEIARAYGEAQYQTYRDNKVEKLIWLNGSNPCTICQQNGDVIVETGKTFPSGDMHEPVHPNCRCSVEVYPY